MIHDFNKLFESRIRLGIMAMLLLEEQVSFNALKDALEVSDGNLANHIKALEAAEYIRVEKSFFGRKPLTRYSATKLGRLEFEKHMRSLEQLFQSIQPDEPGER